MAYPMSHLQRPPGRALVPECAISMALSGHPTLRILHATLQKTSTHGRGCVAIRDIAKGKICLALCALMGYACIDTLLLEETPLAYHVRHPGYCSLCVRVLSLEDDVRVCQACQGAMYCSQVCQVCAH